MSIIPRFAYVISDVNYHNQVIDNAACNSTVIQRSVVLYSALSWVVVNTRMFRNAPSLNFRGVENGPGRPRSAITSEEDEDMETL